MTIVEQEVPLILIIFLSSFGSCILTVYQNFLHPKEETNKVQKAYVVGNLFSVFLTLIDVVMPNKTLRILNLVLGAGLFFYFILSFFLPKEYSLPMLTWSDFFLRVLSVFFLAVRVYASLLLMYDRVSTAKRCCKVEPCMMNSNNDIICGDGRGYSG